MLGRFVARLRLLRFHGFALPTSGHGAIIVLSWCGLCQSRPVRQIPDPRPRECDSRTLGFLLRKPEKPRPLVSLAITPVITSALEGPPFEGETATGSRLSVHPSSAPRLNLKLPRHSTLPSVADLVSLLADHGSDFLARFSHAVLHSAASAIAPGFPPSPNQANPGFRKNKILDVISIGPGTDESPISHLAGLDARQIPLIGVSCHAE